eukprot:TRINITY_DN42908_c0_g1_i1.p1 TRINITY_DN42908_c0_g1~~TRINITY_DN42908_c0_g1_i1.p1  ORF type:complete len:717 (+),score=191.01 TRINITY_DN42908_c0_g1_i1:74-2152(+)
MAAWPGAGRRWWWALVALATFTVVAVFAAAPDPAGRSADSAAVDAVAAMRGATAALVAATAALRSVLPPEGGRRRAAPGHCSCGAGAALGHWRVVRYQPSDWERDWHAASYVPATDGVPSSHGACVRIRQEAAKLAAAGAQGAPAGALLSTLTAEQPGCDQPVQIALEPLVGWGRHPQALCSVADPRRAVGDTDHLTVGGLAELRCGRRVLVTVGCREPERVAQLYSAAGVTFGRIVAVLTGVENRTSVCAHIRGIGGPALDAAVVGGVGAQSGDCAFARLWEPADAVRREARPSDYVVLHLDSGSPAADAQLASAVEADPALRRGVAELLWEPAVRRGPLPWSEAPLVDTVDGLAALRRLREAGVAAHAFPSAPRTQRLRSYASGEAQRNRLRRALAAATAAPCPTPELQLEWTGSRSSPTALAWGSAHGDHDDVFRTAAARACAPGRDLSVADRPLMVEVGSYDGKQAVAAAKAGCRVQVFEPSPNSYDRVVALVKQSGLAEAVTVHRAAAGAAPGTAQFRASRNRRVSTGDSLVGSRQQYEPGNWSHSTMPFSVVEVAVTTLDEALKDEPGVEFLKVDTQGWDLQVLRGAETLLRRRKVRILQFELWPVGIAGATPGGNFDPSVARGLLSMLWQGGYQLARTNVLSLHVEGASGIGAPSCADHLLEYLRLSANADQFGLWVDVVALLRA